MELATNISLDLLLSVYSFKKSGDPRNIYKDEELKSFTLQCEDVM